MWIAIACLLVVVVGTIVYLNTSKASDAKKKEAEKKVYPMPKPRVYPYFYLKECQFFPDGSTRYNYSDEEIADMLEKLEDAVKKNEFFRAMKVSNEIIKIEPKLDKVWLNRLNSIFGEVLYEERAWSEVYSKRVVNSCYGFLQTADNIQDKSLAVKHVLLPLLVKNISTLLKYQKQKVTKYHNFEVYNLLMNLYYVMPYREFLGMISSECLEDKCDPDLEEDRYVQKTVKSFLSHVDMLRTRNTSRLQEKMESAKISNCTLINDDRVNGNIIYFDLNYGKESTRETLEARFFNERGEEIFFGKDEKTRYIDIFELKSSPSGIGKEEIVILADQRIDSVSIRIYNEEEDYKRLKDQSNVRSKENDGKKDANKKEPEKIVPKEENLTKKEQEKIVSKEETLTKKEQEKIVPREENLTRKEIKTAPVVKEKAIENVASEERVKDKAKDKAVSEEQVKEKVEDQLTESEEKEEIEEVFVNEKVEDRKILMYPAFSDIKKIVANDYQLVCLKNNGTVVTIGSCIDSQQVVAWNEIADVYVQDKAIYAIKNDGSVFYLGASGYDGAEYLYSWGNIKELIPAEKHIIARTANSTLTALGNNQNGQCNVGDWYDIVQVEARYHTVGLAKDGTVKATGENNFGECDVKAWKDIVQIGVGEFFTVALSSSGKVFATGLNSCGQCNVGDWANIRKIFVSEKMTVGLRYDGRVVIAGKNIYRFDDVKKWNNIKDVVVTENRVIGIEQDGTVRAAGKPLKEFVSGNWYGVKSVVVNKDNIVALKEDGTLLSNGLVFGQNLASELYGVKKICENKTNGKMAILTDADEVKIWSTDGKNVFPSVYEAKDISLSETYLAVLKKDGHVVYLDFSKEVPDLTFSELEAWNSVISAKAGNRFIAGLTIEGNVKVWGTDHFHLSDAEDWRDIVKIDVAGNRIVALNIEGKLLLAGANEFGEGDFIRILKGVKDFAVSELQIMVLHNDGTVKLTYNPIGASAELVSTWRNVKKVVARNNNFVALTEDGFIFSTIENEVELAEWHDIDDIAASDTYVLGYVYKSE